MQQLTVVFTGTREEIQAMLPSVTNQHSTYTTYNLQEKCVCCKSFFSYGTYYSNDYFVCTPCQSKIPKPPETSFLTVYFQGLSKQLEQLRNKLKQEDLYFTSEVSTESKVSCISCKKHFLEGQVQAISNCTSTFYICHDCQKRS